MPKNRYIEYKINVAGKFCKMPRESAKKLALGVYDRSPIQGAELLQAINLRLKGSTIQQFIKERERERLANATN